MTLNLTTTHLPAETSVPLVPITVWRVSARQARTTADTPRAGTGLVPLTGRVVPTAAAIVGAQRLIITHPGRNARGLPAVLGLPAPFAAYTPTRALTVTQINPSPRRRRGGGRR